MAYLYEKRIDPGILDLSRVITGAGASVYLIGGAVLDVLFSGNDVSDTTMLKDYDLECHGIDFDTLVGVLTHAGYPTNLVGKSFGVIITRVGNLHVDVSIPRIESKAGIGHKDFDVTLIPDLGVKEAARRRDLTINAISICLPDGVVTDPWGGVEDFEKGLLRAVSADTFADDPLRVLRIMQLLPRKAKTVDPSLITLCSTMVDAYSNLSSERVFEEFNKLLLLAYKPSTGLQFLKDCGWWDHFPELKNCFGIPQYAKYHPEGDVWNHVLHTVDAAATRRSQVDEDWKLAYMYGMLLHDVGKPATTSLTNGAHPANGHAQFGAPIAKEFMQRLTNNRVLIKRVHDITKYHMRPYDMANAKAPAWRKLHNTLRLDILGHVNWADVNGRGREYTDDIAGAVACSCKYHEFGNSAEPIKAILQGKDLIALGWEPGKHFKPALNAAYEAQMDGVVDKAQLVQIAQEGLL